MTACCAVGSQDIYPDSLDHQPPSLRGRPALFQRHDWVWVSPDHLDPALHDQRETIPLVVTRRSQEDVANRVLRLGLCVPSPENKKPIKRAFSCPEHAIIAHRPALLLDEVMHDFQAPVPSKWTAILDALAALQSQFGFPFRVFGSVAWQVLSPAEQTFLRESSDLDLLICPPRGLTQERLSALLHALYSLSQTSESAGGPRLDGELRHEVLGDLSWKEMHLVSSQPDRFKILSKRPDSVSLVDLSLHHIPIENKPYYFHPEELDAWAIEALTAEACAWPKPGLVSPIDCGSHDDMDIHLLLKAIHSLKTWFAAFARAAQAGAEFQELAAIGRAAEAVMMRATQGVNVYRGAIFNMGLLVAAAALSTEAEQVTPFIASRWGPSILAHRPPSGQHGTQLRQRLGTGGALKEAAEGFPVLMQYALPAYLKAYRAGYEADRCLVASLMASMAHLEDTNLLWRGGPEGLAWAQQHSLDFIQRGGVHHPEWQQSLSDLHEQCVAKRLSPGGSADMAACAVFLGRLKLHRDTHDLRHAP